MAKLVQGIQPYNPDEVVFTDFMGNTYLAKNCIVDDTQSGMRVAMFYSEKKDRKYPCLAFMMPTGVELLVSFDMKTIGAFIRQCSVARG